VGVGDVELVQRLRGHCCGILEKRSGGDKFFASHICADTTELCGSIKKSKGRWKGRTGFLAYVNKSCQ